MINKNDLVDMSLICTGLGISLIDLQNILSIIILIFDLLWILVKVSIKFFNYMRDGKLTDGEIKDLKNDLEIIKIKKEDDSK